MNLSTTEVELFYRLHGSWMAFANRELQILPPDTLPEQVRRQPIELILKLRDAAYSRADLLEQYLSLNPDRLPPDELQIIASWQHRLAGDFYIMKHLKAYSVFMSAEKHSHLYGVLGLFEPLDVVIAGARLPVLVQAVLLPFRGQIIYDGLMNVYPLSFGPGIRANLNETYRRLKAKEGIIESLVEPDGQPLIRTSLARKVTQPATDWRPLVEEIVAKTQKMRGAETDLQTAALSLLRAAANLTQAAFQEQDAINETSRRMKAVRRAMTQLERLLFDDEEEW